MNVAPSRSTIVRVAVAVAVVASLAGLGGAHGTFGVLLFAQEQTTTVGSSDPYRMNLSTGGPDDVPRQFANDTVRVNYTVLADGEPIDSGELEMDFLSFRNVDFEHAFSEPGTHELAVNATYSLGDGAWQRESRSVRVIEVEPSDGGEGDSDAGGLPGFGVVAALVATLLAAAALRRRS